MATFSGEVNHLLVGVSPDIHICGFSKQQYNNVEHFFLYTSKTAPRSHRLVYQLCCFFVSESFQTCVPKVKKTQKTPSKKMKSAFVGNTTFLKDVLFHFVPLGCTFKTQYGQKDMERHILTHTGERPFECELCHKRFSRRDKLNLHSRLHTGEKPHKCKYCPYTAADSSSLKKHLRIHYDERPFKCQICPYTSRNSSQLTVHLRSHTGEHSIIDTVRMGEEPPKPLSSRYQARLEAAWAFRCYSCEASFVREDSLRSHKRQHNSNVQQQSQTVTKQPVQTAGQTSVTTNTPSSYSTTHLKIIIAPSIGPEATFVQAAAGQAGAVLLGPEDHDVLLNPVIQHVNMLAPESGLEQKTVLLTQIDSSETTPQTSTHNFIASCSASASDGTHTFITSCFDLESHHKLIQEGGTEVTVVTETNPMITTTKEPLNIDGSSSQDVSKHAEDSLDMGPPETFLVQSLPLSISTQDQDHLSPHHLFSD
uniref:Zinc finger protein 64 homolog (mouse) n=1 Tax=Sinocyclocheilus rhinocerous TaxID=307959 RepID=A0A673INX0_9TELE